MTYREVLHVRHVPRLLAGTLVGRLPNGMSALAITLVLREADLEFGFVGVVVGGYLTASAAAGPLLGRLVDRYGPALVMAPTAVLGGAALVVLAGWPHRAWVALPAAVVAGVGTPPLEPTLRALWPRLVPRRLLGHAYGVDSSSQTLIFVVGPVLVSAAAGWMSARAAVLLAVALMLAGTAAVLSSPAIRRAGDVQLGWAGVRGGPLWSRPFAVLVVGLAGAGGSVGAFNVFAVDYTDGCVLLGGALLGDVLAGASAAGSLPAVAALAGLLGGLLVGGRSWRRRRVRILAALLAAGSAALLLTPPCSPAVYLAAASTGVFLPPLLGSAFAVVNTLVPAGRSAEALAWLTTLFLAGSALATVLSGAAAQAVGPPGAAAVAAAMAATGALVCLRLRSVDG